MYKMFDQDFIEKAFLTILKNYNLEHNKENFSKMSEKEQNASLIEQYENIMQICKSLKINSPLEMVKLQNNTHDINANEMLISHLTLLNFVTDKLKPIVNREQAIHYNQIAIVNNLINYIIQASEKRNKVTSFFSNAYWSHTHKQWKKAIDLKPSPFPMTKLLDLDESSSFAIEYKRT